MYEKESKALSFILRHGAVKMKIQISKTGYVKCDTIVAELQKKWPNFSQSDLVKIVKEDEKSRYHIDRGSIRANQGHSMGCVKITFVSAIPPTILYHGTDQEGLKGIKKTGIQKMKRHHVHLTDDPDTATSVGIRHGSEALIVIDTRPMVADGVKFYQSPNGVWLTDFVDAKYLNEVNWR